MVNINHHISIINGHINGYSYFLNRALFNYPCKSETECSLTTILLNKGVYLFEVWGAQGGNSLINHTGMISSTPESGGKGGYSRGTLYLSDTTKVFLSVGSKGYIMRERRKNGSSTFGGGGGVIVEDTSSYGTSGGGASDIRINEDTLYHRVIVAGGGGGASGGEPGIYRPGGSGGGPVGSNGYYDSADQKPELWSEGGSQTKAGTYTLGEGQTGIPASFNIGGPAHNVNTAHNYGGGGGGGWYGGAGGGHRVPGAGGSGFVFNDTKNIPTDYKLDSLYIIS